MHLLRSALVGIACAVVSSMAKPLSDVHATSLELYAVNALEEGGRFAVTVSRQDELVEKDDVVAAKFTDIIMLFDVTPKGDITVNGHEIPMGLSNVQVEAATIYGSNPQALNMTRQELEKSFDVGVVGIQVLATSEKVEVDGQNVTRISIAERVYELNGKEVVQGNQDDTVVGQIVDVYPDGHMVRQKACPMAVGEKLMPSPNGHRSGCMRRFAKWFNALNMSDKAIFVSASGTLILVFYAMIARLAYKLIRGDDEAQKEPFEFFNNDVVEEVKYEKVTISYEMPPSDPVSEEDDLPAYGPGYQAVATSEPKN